LKKIIPYIILAGTIIGCSTTKEINYGRFDFEYNGQKYHIKSQLNPKGEGGNTLISNGTIIARDYDQDTTIDQIINGEVTITEAQRIYDYGLDKLKGKNMLKESTNINRYKTSIDNNLLVATGCGIDSLNCRIELLGELANKDRIFAIDLRSDGIIDSKETGYTSIEQIQQLYTKLLQKGINEGTITKEGEKYKIGEKK
jgi:hypothetical protein